MMEAVCDPAGEIWLAVMLEEVGRPCEAIAGSVRSSFDRRSVETAAFESIMTGNLIVTSSNRAMSTVTTTTTNDVVPVDTHCTTVLVGCRLAMEAKWLRGWPSKGEARGGVVCDIFASRQSAHIARIVRTRIPPAPPSVIAPIHNVFYRITEKAEFARCVELCGTSGGSS
jgi:hypothetical protein